MNCKFCNAELAEGVTLCPECGKENMEEVTEEVAAEEVFAEETVETPAEETVETPAEETEAPEEEATQAPEEAPKKRSIWVTVLAIIGAIALLAVLVGAVIYGLRGNGPKVESYTVSDQKAERERTTVVATVGDAQLTNSELQIYYWQSVNEFYNYMSYYMDIASMGLDLSQPLDQQFYNEEEGITWQQHFLEMALNTWHRYAAMGQRAEAEGFALDPEAQAYLDTIPADMESMAVTYGYESAADMLYKDMSAACDMEGYLRYVDLNFYVGQYFNTVYAQVEPSMEELESYYAENKDALAQMGIVDDGSKLVDVRHILFTPQGGSVDETTGNLTYSDAEWEACRQQAQDLLDQWLADDATEEGFAQLAINYSQDPGSQSTGGLYTGVYEGQMVAPFEEWCFDESRQYGDSGLVQTSYGYHIMYFVGAEDAWVTNLRTQLVNERSTALVDETVENYPMEVKMDKIVLGNTITEE